MKLVKVQLSFGTEGATGRSVTLAALGTPYAVKYSAKREGIRLAPKLEVIPAELQDSDEGCPSELECILVQGEVLQRYIAHFISCGLHADVEKLCITDVHENLERAKVKAPFVTEMTFENLAFALSTGIPLAIVAAMGLARQDMVTQEPNEFEETLMQKMLAAPPKHHTINPDLLADVVLDYEASVEPLSDDDRVRLAEWYAALEQSDAEERAARTSASTSPISPTLH